MKRKTKATKQPVEPIWWLFERDLRCWVAVLHGRCEGKLKLWTYLTPRTGDKGREFVLQAISATTHEMLEVEKISESDLLAWWRKQVELAGCTWDEGQARLKFNFLILKYEELAMLQAACKSASELLGDAAPIWLRMVAHKHYCGACSELEEHLARSSTVEDVLRLEIAQAAAHLESLRCTAALFQGNSFTLHLPATIRERKTKNP